jgi:hypothetical protein
VSGHSPWRQIRHKRRTREAAAVIDSAKGGQEVIAVDPLDDPDAFAAEVREQASAEALAIEVNVQDGKIAVRLA